MKQLYWDPAEIEPVSDPSLVKLLCNEQQIASLRMTAAFDPHLGKVADEMEQMRTSLEEQQP